MKYVPTNIANAELDIARSAMLGAEFAVYITATQAILLGQVNLTASGTGVWVPQPGAAISVRTAMDVCIVPITPISSSAPVEITLTGTDTTASPVAITMKATFSPPARSGNQSANFARGFAQDMAVAASPSNTGLVEAIDAVQTPTIVGGGINQSFRVYQLPEQSDYELIVASTDIKFNAKDRQAKGIDAGMVSDYWVKMGKSLPGELSIGSKFVGFSEGLARYSGQKCTVMLLALKEQLTATDRLVFTGWTAANKPSAPEGDGEITQTAEGKYVDHLFFIAH